MTTAVTSRWSFLFKIGRWWVGVPQVISVVALIYGIVVLCRFWAHSSLAAESEGKVHILLWTIGPPVYFFWEYLYLKHCEKYDPDRLAEAKTWQDLATKFWAGLLAAMLFLTKVR